MDVNARYVTMRTSLLLCALAYIVAGAVAVAVGCGLRDFHPIVVAGMADLAATLVVYGFSTWYRNSSFYDPYWSVAPIAIAFYWAIHHVEPEVIGRHVVALAVVLGWAVRLTFNWVRRWEGLRHEDWRYVDFRTQYGRNYWIIDLSGIHLFPTVQVFLGCLPLYPALSVGHNPLGLLDGVAFIIGLSAIVIETIADQQLWDFLATKNPGEILATGLWRYSRHPNYFGEILFWWSVWLFGVAADSSWWWTIVGPLAITLMFQFASVPMLDKRSVERRRGYAEHMQRVSAIVPWFPKLRV